MCYGCYEKYGKPEIINDATKNAVILIEKVYDMSCSGGNAHVVIDDWNIDDQSILWCLNKAISENICESRDELIIAEKEALEALLALSIDERASALAIVDGYIKYE